MPRKIVRSSGPFSTWAFGLRIDPARYPESAPASMMFDFARKQSPATRRRVGADRREDDFLEIMLGLFATSFGFGLKQGFYAGLMALDRKGAGAVGVERRKARRGRGRPASGATELFVLHTTSCP